MKITFQGGLLDGYNEYAPDDHGWDDVKKVGVVGPSGRIVEYYLRFRITTDPEVTFTKASGELTVDPQETVRLIKLKAPHFNQFEQVDPVDPFEKWFDNRVMKVPGGWTLLGMKQNMHEAWNACAEHMKKQRS